MQGRGRGCSGGKNGSCRVSDIRLFYLEVRAMYISSSPSRRSDSTVDRAAISSSSSLACLTRRPPLLPHFFGLFSVVVVYVVWRLARSRVSKVSGRHRHRHIYKVKPSIYYLTMFHSEDRLTAKLVAVA